LNMECGWQEISSCKMFLDLFWHLKFFAWFQFDIYNVPLHFSHMGILTSVYFPLNSTQRAKLGNNTE
jgi:hypothetical protein